MKTIAVETFEYDELSDKAKAKARDWYREGATEMFSDTYGHNVIEDAARMGDIIGIEIHDHPVQLHGGGTRRDPSIWWQLGYMQSDGVWIQATIRHAKGGAVKIRTEAPEDTVLHDLADRLAALQKAHRYNLTATVKDDSRRPMDLDVDAPGEVTSETYDEIRAIVRDFQDWVYKNLRAEDEYASSDDAVAENIRANEYTFRASGERFDG